jgi:uncharacterized protein YndB with AHSA1/START domain
VDAGKRGLLFMSKRELTSEPVAEAALLIRRPVGRVFNAFVDPVSTTKFWFTKSSGKLEAGKKIRWDWEMYNVSVDVLVKEIEPNKRIVIDWGSPGENPTTVEWVFDEFSADQTFVSVKNFGFRGTADEIVKQALDSAGGFALVLAGSKALLEHGINLNLIADRFPDLSQRDRARSQKN